MNDPAISEELCVLECWEEMTMKKYHRNRTMTQNKSDHFRIFTPTRLAMSIVTALFIGMVLRPASTMAQDYFDPQALELNTLDQDAIDLERFSSQGGQLPGTYRVDIYLNDTRITQRDVNFVEVDGALQPEVTPQQLQEMGVKLDAFPTLEQLPASQSISRLNDYIPDASSRFTFAQQRVDISIPQAALTSEARGYVDPRSWDQGLTAGLLNYSFTGANTARDNHSGTDDSYYLNLRSGVNFGEWRLRNYSAYNESNGDSNWENVNTYAQRDIQSLKGQLTLGDSSTPGDVFNSVQYRGAQLASDDNMFPDSLKGFAPVVRGIAQSNAQITVRQNGYIIYQTYVPPGAFTITDLYPTSSSGDMEVIIREADGTERRSVQPFSAVPVMLREGRLKYSATLGEYRSTADQSSKPVFAQGTLIYGLPYAITLYGGLLGSADYAATSLGVGHGFGDWGSISVDVTQAKTQLRNGSRDSGQSYRFQYSKDIATTGTSFTLAGYRYSTSGYYDFQEANEIDPDNFNNWRGTYNKRSKAQVNISQSLGDYGNFYVNGYQQDFWGHKGYERTVSAGYNTSYNGVTYGLDYSFTQAPVYEGRDSKDQQLSFYIQVPLDEVMPNSWARYNVNTSKQGNTVQDVSLSGTALADNNLSYNVQQGYATQGAGASGSADANYKGTYGEAKAGFNYDRTSQQVNYGVEGGVVVHPYGVTFSQQQGETMALVRAPGASDVKVQNNTGVSTDWRGYAVVPYISTYRKNRIALDSQTLPDDIDLQTNTKTVIPTKGAIVLADFQTRVGSRVLLTLTYLGKPVPFGASATVVENTTTSPNTGIVGLEGELYLSGVPEKGELQVQWGEDAIQQCKVNFNLPVAPPDTITTVRILKGACT
ncbi:MAG TPA: fimbrial biogenesis outer membrane usher protein [Pseudomonas lactis]|uniref:Fimbrial biogenesis outer membrane usher protein n=1 Tax=Pseudomonas lactis TaxID=1615674 RepID=A0A921T7Z1_9PSED|nr:fimbria/pilus outer membrane usher protein [Pseudomonas lactis]HJH19379.1 fimbrial biogenesis outer membrane usher protein [Pseudomonas lactis]